MSGQAATTASTYSFSSQPKAVGTRKKYRDPNEEVDSSQYRDPKETCITWDKRVHRGNTYSMYTQNAIKEALELAENPPPPPKRVKGRPKEKSLFDMGLPQKERVPVDLTDNLTAKEVPPEMDTCEAQTDEFLPEPPPEQYQPQKTGVDVTTQVEDEDLFIFDYEVEPILDVLINKTLEQSMMEVEEEYELERMAEFKVEWFQRQAAMMQDWDKQVAEEWVRWNEKEEVMRKKREEKRREAQVLLKIQAMAASHAHLKNLVPSAVRSLSEVAFPDSKAMAINRIFLPQLLDNVRKQVSHRIASENCINNIMAGCVRARADAQKAGKQAHSDKWTDKERRRVEEAQTKRGSIRIYVDDGHGNKVPVGPIKISSDMSIEEVQTQVEQWLEANAPDVAANYPWGVVLLVNGEPCKDASDIFEAKSGQTTMLPKEEPVKEEVDEDAEGGVEGEVDGAGDAAAEAS